MNEVAQAYSHFTFERSRGQFLVCNIQGISSTVEGDSTDEGMVLSLIHPAVHTSSGEQASKSFTRGNRHEDGFVDFFTTHRCNETCRHIGLESRHDDLVAKNLRFRKDWPRQKDYAYICCSNIFCQRGLSISEAKKPKQSHWYVCADCLAQMDKTSTIQCSWPGRRHEFRTHAFTYKSRGEEVPTMCYEHRNLDHRHARGDEKSMTRSLRLWVSTTLKKRSTSPDPSSGR